MSRSRMLAKCTFDKYQNTHLFEEFTQHLQRLLCCHAWDSIVQRLHGWLNWLIGLSIEVADFLRNQTKCMLVEEVVCTIWKSVVLAFKKIVRNIFANCCLFYRTTATVQKENLQVSVRTGSS